MIEFGDKERKLSRLVLPEGHVVEIWQWSLLASAAEVRKLTAFLSGDECARADGFIRTADRDAFIVAHAEMRRILGSYCGVAPHDLILTAGPMGKPRLDASSMDVGGDSYHFNLSHSGEHALLAVSRAVEVGIDLEVLRPLGDPTEWGFLSAEEETLISTLPPSLALRAGFRLWTRKEAALKAIGSGLLRDPKTVCVLADELAYSHSGESHADGDHDRVSIRDLSLGSGYVGALAYTHPLERAHERGRSLNPSLMASSMSSS